MAEFMLNQSASEVQRAINNALYPDPTLSVGGKPADAKAVGDAFSEIAKFFGVKETEIVAAGFKKEGVTFYAHVNDYFNCWKATIYFDGFQSIKEGADYEVTWDGVTHLLKGTKYNGKVMLGNANIYDSNNPDSGEPFVLMNVFLASDSFDIYTKAPGPHDVGLDEVNVIYNKIPEEYLPDGIGGGTAAEIGEVTLLASGWNTDGILHSQVVNIEGVTARSQVDLTPSVEQLVIFYEKDLTFVTENDDGVVTVFAIGQKPTNDYTIQVTITEVIL